MKLYLVRHAKPAPDQYDNRPPGPGLGEIGRRQSNWISTFLSDKNIEAIYASDFVRTEETAELIGEGAIPVLCDLRLRERQAEEESHESLVLRVHDWLAEHSEKMQHATTAIVAHGGSLNMILEYFDPTGTKIAYPYQDRFGVKTPIAGVWVIDLGSLQAYLTPCPIQ